MSAACELAPNERPLLDLDALAGYLDTLGMGRGPIAAERIGDGHSNVTYRLQRGAEQIVLRRPPPPPLPPSAHDMVREARVQVALERAGARVPHVRAVCEDERVLGVPFYLMDYLPGRILTTHTPPGFDRRAVGLELVAALAEIHAVDWRACGLEDFGKPTGYLERQVRRFTGLWDMNATRELPLVGELAAWLHRNVPVQADATVVHGDYRLGNVMFAEREARLVAALDWELSTIGDPLADVGYLLATYTNPGEERRTPLELSPVTCEPGYPSRRELAERYAELTGRSAESLTWYEALALWKAAIFCEAIYGRYLRGEKPGDSFAASLADGVPRLLEVASLIAAR